jgi:hypothetical protein
MSITKRRNRAREAYLREIDRRIDAQHDELKVIAEKCFDQGLSVDEAMIACLSAWRASIRPTEK